MSAGGALVALVEGESAIAEGLSLNLKLIGYRCEVIGDGETALARVEAGEPDLLLLDLNLPKHGGLWVLEELRRHRNYVPVIVLSARQDVADKVAALGLGADDYITKPFALAEVFARIEAVLRRARLLRSAAATEGERPARVPNGLLRFGDSALDLEGRSALRGGLRIKLTHLEFELLTFLCSNRGTLYSREELLRRVWGFQQAQPRTVDNFVAQLRAKLEDDPERPRYLLTVRGSGYRFAAT